MNVIDSNSLGMMLSENRSHFSASCPSLGTSAVPFEGKDMKRIAVIAAALTVALSLPASAQMVGGGRGLANMHDDTNDKKEDPKQKKADERAYKDALERIPASKEKYDPWGGVRESKADTKPKPK